MDIAHKDDFPQFTGYAYAAMSVQLNVPRTFHGAMMFPEAELWNATFNMEIKCAQDLEVFKLAPRSTVPPGQKIYKSK